MPESEFNALAPEGVSIHAARVPLGMLGPDGEIIPRVGPEVARAFSEPPEVDAAVSSLAALEPSALVYAFTSSSYIVGPEGDARLQERLEQRVPGVPVVVQTPALIAALTALGAERIALIHPPWFPVELDRLGAAYFSGQGLDVVHHGSADLRKDYGDITAEQIFEWVRGRVPDSTDAVVIGGGGFRAIGAIAALESALGRAVVSANQAAFWFAMRKAGLEDEVQGYGRLFKMNLPVRATPRGCF